MTEHDLNRLEQQVAREADILARLPRPQPDAAVVARVRERVVAEAARVGPVPAAHRRVPRWLAMAASVAMAVGLVRVYSSQSAQSGPALNDVERLNLWVAALGDSTETMSFFLDEGWMLNSGAADVDAQTETDFYLDGLDASFETFNAL